MTTSVYFDSQLPWKSANQENKKFGAISIVLLVLTLAFAYYVINVELPEIPREEKEQLPPQLARIIQAEEPPPPPPQVEPEPEPEPEIIEEPEPEPEIEPIEEPVPEVDQPPIPVPEEEPEITEEDKVEQARNNAKSKGVLAFSDTLASMRNTQQLQNLANTQQTQGGGQAEETARNTIGAPNLAASNGLQNSEFSTDVGAAGQLEGRRNTEFQAASEGEAALATKRIEEQSQVVGSRDLDQIRQTLDANKGAVYSLYRRALRNDPTIEGKLTVKLIIEPDGTLSSVELVDDELGSPELVERLISRIRAIQFGSANVTRTELEYAYNFLPY
ncbi:AgmX/PglI C-terminal domain-containing protein [Glaciecola sp. 1036]|uniref:AgmX/PglI C-terminal domain-containing protein n=1 Tax=Alteromonadaceae TaxID=72275 RepID=UPI003D0856D0